MEVGSAHEAPPGEVGVVELGWRAAPVAMRAPGATTDAPEIHCVGDPAALDQHQPPARQHPPVVGSLAAQQAGQSTRGCGQPKHDAFSGGVQLEEASRGEALGQGLQLGVAGSAAPVRAGDVNLGHDGEV